MHLLPLAFHPYWLGAKITKILKISVLELRPWSSAAGVTPHFHREKYNTANGASRIFF